MNKLIIISICISISFLTAQVQYGGMPVSLFVDSLIEPDIITLPISSEINNFNKDSNELYNVGIFRPLELDLLKGTTPIKKMSI